MRLEGVTAPVRVCVCVLIMCVWERESEKASAVHCQVLVGGCGSIFISGCQGGDTLMNGAE